MAYHTAGAQRITSETWWATLVRGVLAILLAIAAFAIPGMTLIAFVYLWGAYAVIDGIGALVVAFGHRAHGALGLHLVEGVAGIIAGVLAFALPGMTALVLLFLVAGWAIVTGVFEVIAAYRLRRAVRDEWLLALGGFISIALGIALVVAPGAGMLALVWLVGAYALLFGLSLVALAFRERRAAG